MSEVKWIKIVTDIFDDEKILLIESMPEADSLIVIWFKLLCLAGKNNNSGVFTLNDRIAYTDEMISTIFRRPINTVRMALKMFEQYGMIEIVNGVITIPKWGKHQALDQLEAKKQYMRNYMSEYRQKQLCKTNSKTNNKTNVSEADIDKDIDVEEDKKINTPSSKFVPPTLEEVKNYCKERKNSVDPEKFINHYEANGWVRGKTKIKDWKACVRTWEGKQQPQQQKPAQVGNFQQREYDDSYYDKLYKNGKGDTS